MLERLAREGTPVGVATDPLALASGFDTEVSAAALTPNATP